MRLPLRNLSSWQEDAKMHTDNFCISMRVQEPHATLPVNTNWVPPARSAARSARMRQPCKTPKHNTLIPRQGIHQACEPPARSAARPARRRRRRPRQRRRPARPGTPRAARARHPAWPPGSAPAPHGHRRPAASSSASAAHDITRVRLRGSGWLRKKSPSSLATVLVDGKSPRPSCSDSRMKPGMQATAGS